MSTAGIIVILLTVTGFLIVTICSLFAAYVHSRFGDHGTRLDEHDDRIQEMERQFGTVSDNTQTIIGMLKDVG